MATPLLLFAVALVARVVTGSIFGEPAYPDSYYYVNVARELAAGHGFQVDFIWNFVDVGGSLPPDPTLPVPSNAHWMPLAALIQVPFIWALGPTPLASALPFWLIGAAAAPLTWAIARDAGAASWQGVAAGLMAAMPGAASVYLAQPDNFALYITLGALALFLCGRGLRGDRRAFVVGGAVVGLATLSRNDGVLLGLPFALAFGLERLRALRGRLPRIAIGWRTALLCAGAFVLVTAPWWLRQLAVFGTISPSSASGRILWITEYRELYSISGTPSLQTFLGQGLGPLLASRAAGLSSALVIFAAVPLLFFLVPVMSVAAWRERRSPTFAPWLVYAITLFAFSALLFAVHVPYGTFLHSAVALLPHAYVLAVLGVAWAVGWVAARRSSWHAPRATRIFTGAAVAGVLIGAVGGTVIAARAWDREHSVRERVAAALAAEPPGERLMSPDAGGYRYLAGRPGVVTPDDPLPVVEAALRAYDIRWLVLERDHIVPALAPILAGELRPGWLSAPRLIVPADGAVSAGTPEVSAFTALPRAALYAVCLRPDDLRCAP